MLFGLFNEERIEAQKGLISYCPICGNNLIPKCGDINIHHWSHESLKDCDSWSEGETRWHLDWKKIIPERAEIKIGNHRADILNYNNIVIELQHSPISIKDIIEREGFYKKMIWLLDLTSYNKSINFQYFHKKPKNYHPFYFFKWKYMKKSFLYSQKDIFLDLGDLNIFRIMELNKNGSGWGYIYSYNQFIEKYLQSLKKMTEENKMANMKEEALAYESPQTLNIADLEKVSIDIELLQGKGKSSDGEEFTYKYTVIEEKEYRIAGSVIGGVKALLEKIPNLKYFSVIKQGTGMNTRYQVIPYTEQIVTEEQIN